MRRYLVSRFAFMVVTVYAIATILFFLLRVAPGDPTSRFVNEALPREDILALRAAWGLEDALHVQYLRYLRNLTLLEFGTSFTLREPVAPVLFDRIFNSVLLLTPALVLMTVLGVILGAAAGWRRGSRYEQTIVFVSLLGRGMPTFFIGMLVLMLFAYQRQWLPAGGMTAPGELPGRVEMLMSLDFWKRMILPGVTIIATGIYGPMLLMRTSIIEVLGEDFLEVLKAKGLPGWRIAVHAARNAMLPVITSTAVTFAFIIDGQVIVEQIFSWPGAGRLIVQSMLDRDYPVLQAAFFLVAVSVVVANLIADLLYGYLDPRVRYD
ncbi:MAG: ABC transporter permease [Chloroflexi bacterium]|nr:ABC transporter permease [Chloroflexota bacterium]